MHRQLQFPILFIVLFFTSQVMAQNNNRQEYIQSSSPTKNGGRVVSRSAPGQRVQTRTYRSTTGTTSVGRVNENKSSRSTVSTTETRKTFRPQDQVRTPYPYPATTPPRTAQLRTNPSSSFASRNWGRAYNPSVPTQFSTARLAQNCNCGPGFQTPLGQPPATLAPTLTGATTGTADPAWNNNNLNLQFPPVGTPPTGNAFQNWWNPIARGSGAYQPIIRLQNMPPGTYLGQGIIGQPTAYVDGQPIRNLLRYISP